MNVAGQHLNTQSCTKCLGVWLYEHNLSSFKSIDENKCKVRQLKVRCSNKSAGCKWVGELGELDNHLKPGSVEGPHDFVDVKCPLQCG